MTNTRARLRVRGFGACVLGILLLCCGFDTSWAGPEPEDPERPYPIVDTAQERCYDARKEILYPRAGQPFCGQDAQYVGNAPRYEDHGDGTVTDLVTGLMWQQDPGEKKTFRQAVAGASACRVGGYENWRLPTIKELYSLILFSGTDLDPSGRGAEGRQPFLDVQVFRFRYGDPAKGERVIDSQFATSTKYVSTTMRGDETMFGVNFADGRIKGYGLRDPHGRREKTFYVLYVRGNPGYGKNDFHDNEDGTVTDRATGLTWMKQDSGHLAAGPKDDGSMTWEQALAWADGLEHAGHADWRLPNAKELQSLVDYTRSPDTTSSAAIDPVFEISTVIREDGKQDFPFVWTSTTHANAFGGSAAVYIAFGESPGWMRDRRRGGEPQLLDVHGAGSQRSDPKDGDPAAFPEGRGPQGDVIRICNFVRCVRGGEATGRKEGPPVREARRRPGRRGGADGPKGRGRSGFVERLDQDGDGQVSRTEFDGPADHFDVLDRDGDGYLSADEAPRGPPPGPPPGRGGR